MAFVILGQIFGYLATVCGSVFIVAALACMAATMVQSAYNKWANTKKGIELFSEYLRYQKEFYKWREAKPVVQASWKNGHCTNCYHQAEVQNIGFNCKGDDTIIHYKHTNYCPTCGAKMDGGDPK